MREDEVSATAAAHILAKQKQISGSGCSDSLARRLVDRFFADKPGN
jgi:hypothetical protein